MVMTSFAKWGNSTALRIPKAMLEKLGMDENSKISLTIDGNSLKIQRELSLEEMVSMITDQNRHELFDFGPDVGREIVEW